MSNQDTYVGLDLSKTSTMATALDAMGHHIDQVKLGPTDEELVRFLRSLPPGRQHIVLEAGNVWEHVYDAAASTGAELRYPIAVSRAEGPPTRPRPPRR